MIGKYYCLLPNTLRRIGKRSLYLIHNNRTEKEILRNDINRRKKLPFTSIKELSNNINIFSPYTEEIHRPNDFYGHASILKKYTRYNPGYQFKFVMEHGVTIDNQVVELEKDSPFKTIVVSSNFRANIWRKLNYKSFSIGPFIYYSSYLLNEKQILKEKKRLGKNLLVFPTHSTPDISNSYNVKYFCNEIDRISKDFDSVRICLYWKDIQLGFEEEYKKHGFEVVTAGHVLDPNFLPRLKSIIKCSTATIANDIGSYTGYCIMMGKPHTILKQELKLTGRKSEINIIQKGRSARRYRDLLSAFTTHNNGITKKQQQYVNYYWGLSEVKTRQELKRIVQNAEEVYNKNQHS